MSLVIRRPAQGGPQQGSEDTGVEENARLTAGTGAVLLVLFAVQIVTVVVSVKSHVTLHVMVGLLLVPPLLVKVSSVLWRFLRYYRHDPAYQRKGPPTLALRIMGPMLLVVTVVLFVSGIVLLLAPKAFGGPHGVMFHLHDVSFYLWLLLIAGHLAGHAKDIRRVLLGDRTRRRRSSVRRAPLRQAAVLVSLAVGLALAISFMGQAQRYQHTVRQIGAGVQGRRAAPAPS